LLYQQYLAPAAIEMIDLARLLTPEFRVVLGLVARIGHLARGGEKGHEISFLRANSLRIRTGNFLPPYRELNRAIRKFSPEEANRDTARCSQSPKPISSSSFVHVKAPQACRKIARRARRR
jgi:superfamily II DNA/RNA helicase